MSSRTTMPQQLLLHSRPLRKSNSKQKLLSQVAKHMSLPAKKCSRSKRDKRRHLRRSRPLPWLKRNRKRRIKQTRRVRLKIHIRSFKKSMVVSTELRTLAMTIRSWMHISRRTVMETLLPYKLIPKPILKKWTLDSCSKNIETTCSLKKSRRIEPYVIEILR